MTLEEGIFEFAAAQSEVMALIGEASRLRLFRSHIPQNAHSPCSVQQRVTTERSRTQCGTIRLLRCTLQLDHYATNIETAQQVGDTFRRALVDYRGMMGDVDVRDVSIENEFPVDEPEPGLHRWSQSYSIWYVE